MAIGKNTGQSTSASTLRHHAEERLRAKTEMQPPRTEEALQRLVHELEVHQVELEMLMGDHYEHFRLCLKDGSGSKNEL